MVNMINLVGTGHYVEMNTEVTYIVKIMYKNEW